jgi:hypothetical protein
VHNYNNIAAVITDIAATTGKKLEKKDMYAVCTREEIHIISFTCEPLLKVGQ